MKVTKLIIRQEAQKLIENCSIINLPVNLEVIADSLNIKVVHDKLEDDISGFIKIVKNTAVCVINSSQHKHRQRFTLGHEIGHFVLHRYDKSPMFVDKGYHYRNADSSRGEIRKEIEANQFAAELLMPRKLIKMEFDRIGENFDSDIHIYELSKAFQVSEQALSFRLQNIGLMETFL
jgi:Zn-dependent peptidase ImmA (M78 family)